MSRRESTAKRYGKSMRAARTPALPRENDRRKLMRSRPHSLLGSVALLLGTIAVVIFFSGSESLPSIVAANGAANGPAKVASQAAAPATNAATGPSGYHLLKTVRLGGEGFWDYLAFDSPTRRLFISRGTKVVVLDVDSEKVVGEIPDTQGVHGIALAPELHDGFTSNGMAGTVTIFDMSTLQVIGHADAGKNPDAIVYDPSTKRVFTMNGRSNDSTAIDAVTGKVLGTIALGGKPDFA